MAKDREETGGLIIAPGCENECIFCGKVRKREKDELREQEINILKNIKEFKQKGIKRIEISGNDPIEYDKIIPLIKYLKKKGFNFICLSTHGRRLADDKFFNDFINVGVTIVRVPLYGSNSEVHDAVTNSKGSFEETFKGIKKISEKAPHIRLQISTLILKQNKDDLTKILDLVKKLNVTDNYFSTPFFANEDFSYYIPLKELPKYTKKIYQYAKKAGTKTNFMEMPFCLFETYDTIIDNQSTPPDLGENCQPANEHKSEKKDWPKYRLKEKIELCEECGCNDICDGFIKKDIEYFGTGNLKPIPKSAIFEQR